MPNTVAAGGGLLTGKRGLIMGVANERSLAWGIARIVADHGASLAFSYPNDAVGRRVKALASELNSAEFLQCDVSSDEDLDRMTTDLSEVWRGQPIDFVVHAISYSDKSELLGPFTDHSA